MIGTYSFGGGVSARAHSCLQKQIFSELWEGFTSRCGSIRMETAKDHVFLLGSPRLPEKTGAYFTLVSDENGIGVFAESEKGLICGFLTLLSRIETLETAPGKEKFAVPFQREEARPPIQIRMIHFCVFPETRLFEIRRFIRLAAVLGFTHLVLEFWGTLRFDALSSLSWKFAFTKEEIRPVLREARDLGMELVPMFNHWGHASASRARHGKHVVLDQDPKMQPYFSEDGWTWRIEKEEVRLLMGKIRDELIELFGEGSYFHLGCDEAYNFPVNAENAGAVTGYLNEIAASLAKKGRRAIVWGDMFLTKRSAWNPENHYTASAANEAAEKALLSSLSREIIIADWQYRVSRAPVETALILQKEGFDVILCPWDKTPGVDSVTPCAETVISSGLYGLMHTTWHTLNFGTPIILQASRLSMGRPIAPRERLSTRCAAILRKVYFVDGDYEKAGWSAKDTGAEPV